MPGWRVCNNAQSSLAAQEQSVAGATLSFREISAQETAPEQYSSPSPAPAQPVPVPAADQGYIPEFNTDYRLILFPRTLLWELPLANHLQPRMYMVATSLDNAFTHTTLDTAIGGEAGIIRYGTEDRARPSIQIDFFAMVLSRWAAYEEAVESDYRVGLPLTFACGNWEGRMAYEHTSTHLGDQLIEITGRRWVGHIRDEAVFGLSYTFLEQIRLYGLYGYSVKTSPVIGNRRHRFDWGVEWSKQAHDRLERPTLRRLRHGNSRRSGLRPQHDLANRLAMENLESRASSLRVALELYNGNSPFGQFFTYHEQWIGAGVYLDF